MDPPEEDALRSRLQAHVRVLAGRIGERHLLRPRALDEAAAYLEQELSATGQRVGSQEFTAAGRLVRNLEVESPGRSRPDRMVVVGAHYDTVPGSPGADDNASGVAATLEIARLLAARPSAGTVRCVFFVNEEPPWFRTEDMGSLRYARRSRQRGERVTAMLSLETIGYYSDAPGSQRYPFPLGLAYPATGNFLGFVGNIPSRGLVRRAAAAFRRHARFPAEAAAVPAWIPGVSWSDHCSFWQQGYPAVMVTDTAPFRYPAYHGPEDTPEQLRYDALARVTAGLAATALELAGEGET